jgi:hypothetical protein
MAIPFFGQTFADMNFVSRHAHMELVASSTLDIGCNVLYFKYVFLRHSPEAAPGQ